MIVRAACLLLVLGSFPAAAQIQSDCRGSGNIGSAFMSIDGTLTLTLQLPDGTAGARAFHKNDPQYARMLSHLGGMHPGEHKPVPAFC